MLMNRVRLEKRMMCADMVEVCWSSRSGRPHSSTALLEDISAGGACLQLDEKLALGVKVDLRHGNARLSGTVKYCIYREIGYFAGVQFSEETRWSRRCFRPKHLLDIWDLEPIART